MFDIKVLDSPHQITKTYDITYFKYMIISVSLFNSVSLIVQFYDATDTMHKEVSFQITGDDYSNWANDDNYILQYIQDNLDKIYSN
jgi:hypothetical protein